MTDSPRDNRLMPKTMKLIEHMVTAGSLTHEEVQAILNVTCPFPDTPFTNARWPVGSGSDSVCSHTVANAPISKPAALAEGATWMFHMVMIPITKTLTTDIAQLQWAENGTLAVAGSAVVTPVSAVQIIAVAETEIFPTFGTQAWADAVVWSWSPLDDAQLVNNHRIVGFGVELVNTSTDLNRGGYQYGYRRKTADLGVTHFFSGSSFVANANYMRNSRTFLLPPTQPEEITNYSNTYQGPARNGIAVIAAPNSFENPVVTAMPSEVSFVEPGNYPLVVKHALSPVPVHSWSVTGAFVTGQVAGATWTAKAVMYTEIIPLPSQDNGMNNLLSGMARPEADLNYTAFLAMSHVLNKMPCAFDYSENPFGEWFHKALGFIKQAAPTVGSALSMIHPLAGTVVNAIGHAAGSMHTITKAKKHKQKEKEAMRASASHPHSQPQQQKKSISAATSSVKHTATAKSVVKTHPAARSQQR